MTIDSTIPGRWQEYDGESEQGFRQYKDRVYPVPQAGTLAGTTVSMQEGDTLPDDSTYEIISAKIEMVKPLTGAVQHKGGRAARLRGYKEKVVTEGSGDWDELQGTRKVLETDPQTLRYEITFTAVTATVRPSTGDSYATITGEASPFTTTDLDREPVVVSVSQIKQATILKSHVTCVFEANYARDSTGGVWTEINPRMYVRTGRNSAKGKLRFSGPVASESAMENALYGSVYPNRSGKYAPKCNRVEVYSHRWPNRSLVIADYETPRVVGEGKLRIELGSDQEVVQEYVQSGETYKIGAESYWDGTQTRWGERRIVSGKNIRLVAKSIIVLETAATSFNLNTFQNKVGCVNKYRLPNFGNARPGTLLFLGLPHTTYRLNGDLWYLNLAWKYSGDSTLKVGDKFAFPKWNNMTKSQLGSYIPREIQSVDPAGTVVAGSVKYLQEWIPQTIKSTGSLSGTDEKIITHANFPAVDFREFGKNLTITGISR